MTLEEAKNEIYRKAAEYWKAYRGRDDGAHPEWRGDEVMMGRSDGLDEAYQILEEVSSEPVGNPDILTLKELARELRKIFRFKYLTCGEMFYWGQSHIVLWISNQPLTLSVRNEGGEERPCYIHEWEGDDIIETFSEEDLVCALDLSEYKDGRFIDYSKCIVEVE